MQTTGGTTPEGSRCMFPFQYKGITYAHCTDVDHSMEWCMTDNKNTWGNCDGACGKCITNFIMLLYFSTGLKDRYLSLNSITITI